MKSSLDIISEENGVLLEDNNERSSSAKMSASTSDTANEEYVDDSSASGEEDSNFFGAIGADFRTLAISFKETAGGVANFVQRSARNVAAEIARLEEEKNFQSPSSSDTIERPTRSVDNIPLPLPWTVAINTSPHYEEDCQLREKIFDLSAHEDTFLQPFGREVTGTSTETQSTFSLDEPRIQLIRYLLDIDDNLAATHARLSGRSNFHETSFWKNYFHNCEREKQKYLAQYRSNEDESVPSQDSLIPADDDSNVDDNDGETASFVLPSPPQSTSSIGVRSLDSLVFVDAVAEED